MVDWIYANQGVSRADLRAAAQRILGVTDFDREYARMLPDIRKDIADGGVLNITSTPTYFINGVRLPGGMPSQSFEMAIALEIEAGRGRTTP
jgi:protein-disulfide isomerase